MSEDLYSGRSVPCHHAADAVNIVMTGSLEFRGSEEPFFNIVSSNSIREFLLSYHHYKKYEEMSRC